MKKIIFLFIFSVFTLSLFAQENNSQETVLPETIIDEKSDNLEKQENLEEKSELSEGKGEESGEEGELTEENEAVEDDAPPVEKCLLDSYDRLKALEYDKEIFIPKTENKKQIIIHSNNKNVTRTYYDEEFRLIKKEDWDMTDKINSKLVKITEYEYQNGQKNPVSKSETQDNIKIKTEYTPAGLPSNSKKILEKDNGSILLINSAWNYDEKDRIIEENILEYDKGQIKLQTKQVYNYSKVDKVNKEENKDNEEFPPDYEYYENNKLKIKTVYEKAGTWKNQIYFDDNYSVTTYYVDNKKVKDVYIEKGIVRRLKNYE